MDGRDDANNARNGNNSSPTQGGIFSTPDLTIETENIPEGTISDRPSGNKSRISAAFSKTDATQQSQEVAAAMTESRQNSFASTATGDIQVSSAKKKSKMPLLILAVLAVAAVIVGVTVMVGGGHSNKSVHESFKEYLDSAMFGDEEIQEAMASNGNIPEDEWVLLEIYSLGLSSDVADQYYDTTINYYDAFAAKASTVSDSVTNASNFSLMVDLTGDAIKTFYLINHVGVIRSKMAEIYDASGSQAVLDYVASLTFDSVEGSIVADTLATLKRLFTNEETALTIAKQNGCIEGGTLDISCAEKLRSSNRSYATISEEQELLLEVLDNDVPIIRDTIKNGSEGISTILEDL